VTALMVAWKFEGGDTGPLLDDCVKMCYNKFNKKQFRDAEVKMLTTLQFRIMMPSTWKFIWLYNHLGLLSPAAFDYAYHVIERATLEYDLVDTPTRVIAAAATYISQCHKWVSERSTR
jgi:hypothetical protein